MNTLSFSLHSSSITPVSKDKEKLSILEKYTYKEAQSRRLVTDPSFVRKGDCYSTYIFSQDCVNIFHSTIEKTRTETKCCHSLLLPPMLCGLLSKREKKKLTINLKSVLNMLNNKSSA